MHTYANICCHIGHLTNNVPNEKWNQTYALKLITRATVWYDGWEKQGHWGMQETPEHERTIGMQLVTWKRKNTLCNHLESMSLRSTLIEKGGIKLLYSWQRTCSHSRSIFGITTPFLLTLTHMKFTTFLQSLNHSGCSGRLTFLCSITAAVEESDKKEHCCHRKQSCRPIIAPSP